MNKPLLLICLLISVFSIASSQTNVKKNKNLNKTAGTIAPNFQFQKVAISKVKSAHTAVPFTFQKSMKKALQNFEKDSIKTVFILKRDPNRFKSGNQNSIKEKSSEFMKSIQKELRSNNSDVSFNVVESKRDEIGQDHVRMGQKYKGIKIYNSDFFLHFTGEQGIMNGKYAIINNDLVTKPVISKLDALRIVDSDIKTQTKLLDLSEEQRKFLDYSNPAVDTVIFKNPTTKFSLAYQITIRPNFLEEWKYFVNAQDGTIMKRMNNTKFDGPVTANATDLNGIQQVINTYLENGKYYLRDISEPMYDALNNEGYILTLDAQNTNFTKFLYSQITSVNNAWADKASVSAHFNSIQAFKYYKNTFDRNSINGVGGSIISFINVSNDDGTSMENAFWNGKAAFYGNGGTSFKPLAGALDVAAHELGHGVIENSANLEYEGQSGAINESYADIFGAMAERKNWYIGEDITKTAYIPTGRLRDMSNPHNGGSSLNDNGWQPRHMSEIYTGTGDNGGVHINSGICNYAFYLYATAITKEKAEKIYYKALTYYLNRFSQFIDLRVAIIQSATDLYGANSVEVTKAKEAFDAVGIYEEQQTNPDDSYSENSGQNFLLVYNTDPDDSNTLYRSSVVGNEFLPLTTTTMKGKVSVTDNGSYAVYVSDDDKIRSVTLGNSPSENIISDEAFWDNVAISRDGKRLAGVSTFIDTSVYIYDFVSAKWAQFHLYNPTTQENLKSSGVLYADVIEFDHTGENLIFDAFNSIVSTNGDSINYWDIGLIHVWDKAKNDFADGKVVKLYGSLPENVSIGNPVFSKNSPYIIAFDYWDEAADEYSILGLNIETMTLGNITSNNTIGFPSYSIGDDKIAFNTINTFDEDIVAEINLNTDKISSSVMPSDLIIYAIWPVYYATGTRVLGFAPQANFTASYKTGSAPFTVNFSDLSENDPTSWQWTFTSGNPASSTLKNPAVIYNTPGTYSVSLKVTNAYGNNTITKSSYITVSNATGIQEIKDKVRIYPNPVTDYLYIESNIPKEKLQVSIWTLEGKLIKKALFIDKIALGELKSGFYIAKIEGENSAFTIKIIKD